MPKGRGYGKRRFKKRKSFKKRGSKSKKYIYIPRGGNRM